ncbi:cell-division protein [Capnocytophaga gingivalis]|uniref:cell-division protein n=1 Tax=Capnocytophaga gingivalis TaxID=1017 RepID=UPI0028E87886|nr:cell-division protein [Capnocytophaga gingivalis]
MKTAKQLIEDELHKTIHQLKEVSLLQEEKQALVSYKKELEQLLFLKKLSDTYHLEPAAIEKIIVLPQPSMAFADFRIVDDVETDEREYWKELQVEGEKLSLNEGDILIKKK